jgi:hypothetical protein
MASAILRAFGATVLTMGMASGAFAQVSTNRVAAETDWSVFVEEATATAGKSCWAVSAPKESVNTKDGKPTSVRRGDILLFVTFAAGKTAGEVSFNGGYPFAPGSNPTIEIGGQVFNFFLAPDENPEMAWSASAEDDTKIIAAMRDGASAVMTARSARGTQTKDTFGLSGISAAIDEAAKRCAG